MFPNDSVNCILSFKKYVFPLPLKGITGFPEVIVTPVPLGSPAAMLEI